MSAPTDAVLLVDQDGRPEGWISRVDARILRGRCVGSPQVSEPPQRWLEDPYVAFVTRMVHDQGLLTGDMNPVRQWCLRGHVVRVERRRVEESEAILLAQMSFTAPEAYLQLRERQKQERWAEEEKNVEWRAPQTPDELAEVMEELREMFGDDLDGRDDDDYDDDGRASFEGPDYGDFYEGMS